MNTTTIAWVTAGVWGVSLGIAVLDPAHRTKLRRASTDVVQVLPPVALGGVLVWLYSVDFQPLWDIFHALDDAQNAAGASPLVFLLIPVLIAYMIGAPVGVLWMAYETFVLASRSAPSFLKAVVALVEVPLLALISISRALRVLVYFFLQPASIRRLKKAVVEDDPDVDSQTASQVLAEELHDDTHRPWWKPGTRYRATTHHILSFSHFLRAKDMQNRYRAVGQLADDLITFYKRRHDTKKGKQDE